MQLTASTVAVAAVGDSALSSAEVPKEEIFPFGTHVYREPSLPLEQLRHDMPLLKRLGFNMVKIQESWVIDEKVEGSIDLSNVMRVVSDARDYGLKVYFGVTMEMAPAWLWQKYPDAYLVYNTGQPHLDQLQYVIPADGKPGPCWHHRGAREAAIRFLKEVGSQVGRYDNVLVWNVWQEFGFWPMKPGMLGFCYCENSLREFRIWLQARYGSIQKLNDAWKSGYGTLAEVIPPRVASDLPPYLDFRYLWKMSIFPTCSAGKRTLYAQVILFIDQSLHTQMARRWVAASNGIRQQRWISSAVPSILHGGRSATGMPAAPSPARGSILRWANMPSSGTQFSCDSTISVVQPLRERFGLLSFRVAP